LEPCVTLIVWSCNCDRKFTRCENTCVWSSCRNSIIHSDLKILQEKFEYIAVHLYTCTYTCIFKDT
jgi:hypothetical protein